MQRKSDTPDIFWIVTDEHRCDGIGAYGNPWIKTPNLDRLASEGVLFERAYCQTPACVASRVSFLSGQYSHSTGNLWFSTTPDSQPFFVDQLTREQVATVNIGKEHHKRRRQPFHRSLYTHSIRCNADPTVGWRVEGGPGKLGTPFVEMEEELGVLRRYTTEKKLIIGGRNPVSADKAEGEALCRFACQVAGDFAGYGIADARNSEPLLFRISMIYPHTPVLPPEPYDTMYPFDGMTFPGDGREDIGLSPHIEQVTRKHEGVVGMPEEHIHKMRAHYYGLCTYVDHSLGMFLDYLRENWERPYIVVMHADHGNMLGEHGIHEKFSFYDEAIRVPLLIAGTGIPKGLRIDKPVELVDLAPTMMNWLGVTPSEELNFQGRDLMPLMQDPGIEWKDAAFSEYTRNGHAIKAVRKDRYLLAVRATWQENQGDDMMGALYDMEDDPTQLVNLFHESSHNDVREELVARIRQWEKETV